VSARVAIVGDVMGHLGTAIAEAEGQPLGLQIGRGLWQFAAEHDEVWGNLEGPPRPEPDGSALHLMAWNYSPSPWPRLFFSARHLAVLAHFGFRVLGVANNHTFDFGGALDARASAELLARHGIAAPGADLVPVIREIDGVSVAVFSITSLLNVDTPPGPVALFTRRTAEDVARAIRAARQQVDHVVVMAHWGSEYGHGPSEVERSAAALLFEAGASVVVGAHPHVLWPVSQPARDQVVCWSLGNFLGVFACSSNHPSYGRFRRSLWGAVLSLELDRRRVRASLQPIAVEHSFDAWQAETGVTSSYLGWGQAEIAAWQQRLPYRRTPLRNVVEVHGPARPVPFGEAEVANLDPWRGDLGAPSWTVPVLGRAG
jgi:hypothetical protein